MKTPSREKTFTIGTPRLVPTTISSSLPVVTSPIATLAPSAMTGMSGVAMSVEAKARNSRIGKNGCCSSRRRKIRTRTLPSVDDACAQTRLFERLAVGFAAFAFDAEALAGEGLEAVHQRLAGAHPVDLDPGVVRTVAAGDGNLHGLGTRDVTIVQDRDIELAELDALEHRHVEHLAVAVAVERAQPCESNRFRGRR